MNHLQLVTAFITLWIIQFNSFAYANGPLIVSGNPQAPPIVWEKSGQLTGVGPQLVVSFLDQEGIQHTVRPEGSWEEVQKKGSSGSIDIIVSAYDNKKRREFLDYSIPYLDSPVVIVVKKGDIFAMNSWNDLVGKKGVANTGESFGEKFDAFIKEKLNVAYVPYEQAFTMLEDDRADYLIIDLYPAVIYAKLLKAEDKIEYLENPVTLQNFHVTISKSSDHKSLIPKINAYIKQMLEKGEINKMLQDQYQAWHKTFLKRQRFFERADYKSQEAQAEFNATARDRGLENLMRFVEANKPYISN